MKFVSSIPTFLLGLVLVLAIADPYISNHLPYPLYGWSLYDKVQDNFLKHRFVWEASDGEVRELQLEGGFHLPNYLGEWLSGSYYNYVRRGESISGNIPDKRDPRTFVLIEDYKQQLMDHFVRSLNVTGSGTLKVSVQVMEPLKQVKTGNGLISEVALYEWRVQ